MLIYEFRIILPMTVAEYQIGQLYAVAETSKAETGGGDGIEILKNEPFKSETGIQPPGVEGDYSSGQYTLKIYHLSQKVPKFIRLVAPKGMLELQEEAWNAYPYCKTVFTNPGYMKENFELSVTSLHCNDEGTQNNVHGLTEQELKKRVIVYIDISRTKEQLDKNDYKVHEDPLVFHSEKTNRGPLQGPEWWKKMKNHDMPVMCCYKLVKVNFKWFGLQNRVEKLVCNQDERLFTSLHRQVFCTIDKWVEMDMNDIRELEDRVKTELEEQRLNGGLRGSVAQEK